MDKVAALVIDAPP